MYVKRAMESVIEKYEQNFKAILVTGPRQVGKSTILRHLYENRKYTTFDDPVLLSETKAEPGLFFRNNKPPLILGEVQYIDLIIEQDGILYPFEIKMSANPKMDLLFLHLCFCPSSKQAAGNATAAKA